MAEVNLENIEAVEKVKSFWEKSGKMITYGGLALILVLAGWIGYQKLIKEPKEMNAGETIFLAEGLFGKINFLCPSSSMVPMVSLKASSSNEVAIYFAFFIVSNFIRLFSVGSTQISPSGAFGFTGLVPLKDKI